MSTEDQLRELRSRVEPLFTQSAFAAESLLEFRDEELPFIPFVVVAIVLDKTGEDTAANTAPQQRALEVLTSLATVIESRKEYWALECSQSTEYIARVRGGWGGYPSLKPDIAEGMGHSSTAGRQVVAALQMIGVGCDEASHSFQRLLASENPFATWLELTGMVRLT
jgi:hypothetical protein